MNYEEYIYTLCKDTDMTDEEEATMLVQMIVSEALSYHKLVMIFEDKLKELMTAKDFDEWSKQAAVTLTKFDIEHMADSDFKDFYLENFDAIVKGEYHEQQKEGE